MGGIVKISYHGMKCRCGQLRMINESVSLMPYVWRMYQGHIAKYSIYAEKDSMYDTVIYPPRC